MYPSPWQHESRCVHSIPSQCSLQPCRSFPVHLLRDPGHEGEALATQGLWPAPEEASLCKRNHHFPTATPSPKAASSVPA